MSRILCAAPHCATRDNHHPDCTTPDCWGCQPRPAHDGLRLCLVCTRRLAEDALTLGQMHDDMAHTLRRTGTGERTSGTVDRSPGVDGEVVDARTAIRLALRGIRHRIVIERGIEGRIPTMVACGTLVARHAEWVAALSDAGEHAGRLRGLAADGRLRALAYPCSTRRRAFLALCPVTVEDPGAPHGGRVCGARLFYGDGDRVVTCPGCGTAGGVGWWRQQVTEASPPAIVDAYTGAAWLSMRYCRPVEAGTIRKWGQRYSGLRLSRIEEQVGVGGLRPVLVPVRDARERVLFSRPALAARARKVWGAPATPGSPIG